MNSTTVPSPTLLLPIVAMLCSGERSSNFRVPRSSLAFCKVRKSSDESFAGESVFPQKLFLALLSAILSAAVPAPLMLHFESNAVFLLSNGMWHPGTKRPPPPLVFFDLLDLLVCATPLQTRTAASIMVMDKRIPPSSRWKDFLRGWKQYPRNHRESIKRKQSAISNWHLVKSKSLTTEDTKDTEKETESI